MSGVTVVTGPSAQPVEDNEIKRALRIATDDSTHNNLIGTARSTATAIVSEYLGRSLINQTLKLSLDALPYENENIPIQEGVSVGPYMSFISRAIHLPKPPLQSVTHIKTFNDSDTATTLATSVYYVDTNSEIGRAVLRRGEVWGEMLRVANSMEITYVAGYGSASGDVPIAIRQAIITMAVNIFENPEPIIKGETATRVSGVLESLLRPYVVRRFGIGFS
tara:strand:+ start:1908 stop:2570 length:663 start_codon:yes stop_codon:yes gene_type:complete